MALQWTQKGSLKGPQGDQGDTGPQGPKGAGFRTCAVDLQANSDVALSNITPSDGIAVGDLLVDPQGDVWEVASLGDGTVHTGTKSDLNIQGPKGDQGAPGEKGEDGTGVNIKGSVDTSTSLPSEGEQGDAYIVNDTGNLWVWDEGQHKFVDTGSQIKGPKGDQGDPGEAATVTVGTTQTGEAGTQAKVTASGTDQARVINFVIPRGDKGETGEAGPGITFGSGAPSDPSKVGAMYVDIDTWNVYSYEDTGA